MPSPSPVGTPAADPAATLDQTRRLIGEGAIEQALAILEPLKGRPEWRIEVQSLLAVIAARIRNFAYAIQALRPIEEEPEASTDIPEILAVLYSLVGDLRESLFYAKLATVKKPDERLLPLLGPTFPKFADAFLRIRERPLVTIGEQALAEGRLVDAIDRLTQHVTLFTRDEGGLEALGRTLIAANRHHEAVGNLRSLRLLAPKNGRYASRLAEALSGTGEHDQGLACHRMALALAPADAEAWCAYLRGLAFAETPDTPIVRNAKRMAADVLKATPSRRPALMRAADAPLRIGYLVGGVSSEAEARLVADVMRLHDRARVSVVAIGTGAVSWDRNRVFQLRADRWLDVREVDKHTFAVMVRGEAIDVLVDASGLGWPDAQAMLVLKPAKVQVAWLGTPLGPLRDSVHYRLAAAELPAEDDGARSWLLVDGRLAFPWPVETLPPQRAADVKGYVSFGVDATAAEIGFASALLWSRVLIEVPNARLLLRDHGLSHPLTAERLQNLFGNLGVAHRIEIVKAVNRGEFLREIDVMLTAAPHQSPFAAAEALAHGRPVIGLAATDGAGADIDGLLRSAGVAESMLGADEAAYVAKAVAWAGDRGRCQAWRAEARGKLSPLAVFDATRLARALETAYDGMWRAAAP